MKSNLMYTVILLALSLIIATSCQGSQSLQNQPVALSVLNEATETPTTVSVLADGISEYHLVINASAQWSATLEPDVDWIELKPSSGGKGKTDVYVDIDKNDDISRSVSVEFVCDDKSVTVTFEQEEAVKEDTPEKPEEPLEPEDPVEPEEPKELKADLLDVVFNSDGTAYDASESGVNVQYVPGVSAVTYYNDVYQRYVTHFNHPLGKNITDGYYKIDYTSNAAFRNALADGHSLEIVFRMDEAANGEEIKPFSSMQAGGTGFLITAASRGKDITFLPNVSANGSSNWIWAQSGIVPEVGKYYHVVGVWDKTAGKAYIYVDGVLKKAVSASGKLNFPTSGCTWFCLGADPGTAVQSAFNGDVAVARIYDDPITAEQVNELYAQVKNDVKQDVISVSGLSYLSDATVYPGCWYYIYASGFQSGDVLTLASLSDNEAKYECETVYADGVLKLQVPDGLTAGKYLIALKRGQSSIPLGYAAFKLAESLQQVSFNTKVVAHRGYHPGNVPENSVASLVEAQKLGVYGSEFDVYITLDDVVVLYHNAAFSGNEYTGNSVWTGKRPDSCNYEDIKDYKLSNGENLPTLDDYLDQAEKYPGVKLILEIKTHDTVEKNMRCVQTCVNAVKARDLQSQVEYIAFDFDICKKIAQLDPNAIVQYLGGNIAPADLHKNGIKGIDYNYPYLTDAWIKEAHNLGMVVNVWTVNDEATMLNFINKGVDLLTTDEAEKALALLSKPFVADK